MKAGQRTVIKEQRRMRVPPSHPVTTRSTERVECSKCHGRGKGYMKGHRADCGCVGCRPCKKCDGKGSIEKEAKPRGRSVEVDDHRFDE